METPKEYYYTYYSYEEWGRGYFGSRGCECLPEEDVKYFGSSKDKNFKPTQKIILKSDYKTREEAYADEIILQQYYKVVENPHFANKAYQTSTKFCYILSPEQARENGKKAGKVGGPMGGKISGNRNKEQKKGICGMSSEELSEVGKRGGNRAKELGVGIHSFTPEQIIENAKNATKKARELGVGVYGFTKEQRSEYSKKEAERAKELGVGIFSFTQEQIIENARKGGTIGGKLGGKITSSQRWMCEETGYISTPGGLSSYQKKRGIDTSKRRRIS
jgi:hypothetical protein